VVKISVGSDQNQNISDHSAGKRLAAESDIDLAKRSPDRSQEERANRDTIMLALYEIVLHFSS
jgi:hypothetical protein